MICNDGAILTSGIEQEAHILFINFKKAIAPLAIIAAAVAAVGGIVGWQLITDVGIPWWVWVVGGIVGGIALSRVIRR